MFRLQKRNAVATPNTDYSSTAPAVTQCAARGTADEHTRRQGTTSRTSSSWLWDKHVKVRELPHTSPAATTKAHLRPNVECMPAADCGFRTLHGDSRCEGPNVRRPHARLHRLCRRVWEAVLPRGRRHRVRALPSSHRSQVIIQARPLHTWPHSGDGASLIKSCSCGLLKQSNPPHRSCAPPTATYAS